MRTEREFFAEALEPFAKAKADLQVVMGYRYPGTENKGAIEIYPVKGNELTASAQWAGLTASTIPTLLVEGDNKAGLGHAITKAIADAGLNLSFTVSCSATPPCSNGARVETGMRTGEMLALRWRDIGLLNDTLQVEKSKTQSGIRTVPISALCKSELLRWRNLIGPEYSE